MRYGEVHYERPMPNKRTPLVSQYLEQISSEVFDDYQQLLRQYVRNRHGVYALYRREKLYYVGLAKDLRGPRILMNALRQWIVDSR
jgi:hypothetical protein